MFDVKVIYHSVALQVHVLVRESSLKRIIVPLFISTRETNSIISGFAFAVIMKISPGEKIVVAPPYHKNRSHDSIDNNVFNNDHFFII